MRKFSFLMLLMSVFAALQSHAATPEVPTYAFLSLIGDKLGIVVAQPQTGSRLDQNRNEAPVAIADPVFDNAAAHAAGEAVRKIIPRAELAILNSRSPVLFEKQRELFAEQGNSIAIPEAIRMALQNEKATHLILISKHRDEAQFQLVGTAGGAGMVEGLGFYLDGRTETRSADTGDTGQGYIAPYLYAKVTLVDVQTAKVISKQTIKAAVPMASANAREYQLNPWESLSSAEKIGAINRLIRREIARVVPLLLKVD